MSKLQYFTQYMILYEDIAYLLNLSTWKYLTYINNYEMVINNIPLLVYNCDFMV